ncbi:DUF551 domain-containing protein [Escherichia coli]|nr:DUF551 domain-containing protein [Escherichia coli]
MNDKELIKEIKERISSLDVRDNVERRAYEIALASLTAEPVAWKVTFTQIDREYNTFTGMYSDKAEVERWVRLHKACNFRADITPLYTAKPVPVTQDGWISCSDRMPEIRQTVIGWNGYAVRQCVYTRNEYAKTQKGREPRFETLTGIWHGVTHWMPLPEPPQGGLTVANLRLAVKGE